MEIVKNAILKVWMCVGRGGEGGWRGGEADRTKLILNKVLSFWDFALTYSKLYSGLTVLPQIALLPGVLPNIKMII